MGDVASHTAADARDSVQSDGRAPSGPSDRSGAEDDGRAGLESRVEALLGQLTVTEKVSLLAGAAPWHVPGVERLGIPPLVMSDGPAGVRGDSFVSGRSTSFPCETGLAATWDPALVRDVGAALGREAAGKGVHVLLAPTVNLHRHPLAGRNFECFSEDPFLTSAMACAYVSGVQSHRVACCVKHLVCNDSEFERHTINSEVDEATLREVYLAPFEAASNAGAWSLMASYNKVNGTHASEHPWLLTDVLRDEWGFDGAVISDWYATHSTAEALNAGLDIEMPGPSLHRGDLLLDAVTRGEVPEAAIDASARRVLRLIARTVGLADDPRPVPSGDHDETTSALVRNAGARAMVLLKNENAALPLAGPLQRVAVIGPGADVGMFQGGGSAQVNPSAVAAILPALREAVGAGVTVSFERGCVTPQPSRPLTSLTAAAPDGEPTITVECYRRDQPGEPLSVETARQLQLLYLGDIVPGTPNSEIRLRARAQLHPAETGRYELAVSGTGTVRVLLDGEVVLDHTWELPGSLVFSLHDHAMRAGVELQAGSTRLLEVELLPTGRRLTRLEVTFSHPNPPGLLDRAVALAATADAAIVVAESPHGWETEGRDRDTMVLPGDQDRLIQAVAAVNPRTVVALNVGAPVTMPWADDVAAILAVWFPGQEIGRSLADVLTGAVNPSGRLPVTLPRSAQDAASAPFYPGEDGVVVYGERFNFGYRHRPGEQRPSPLFPFGHGLSYSEFRLGDPAIRQAGSAEDARYVVEVPVTHVSGPAGRQVVQVYVSAGRDEGPAYQLQGFAAVDLDPGQTAHAVVEFPARQLRRWTGAGWRVPAADLKVLVGRSSADLPYQLDLPGLPDASAPEQEDTSR